MALILGATAFSAGCGDDTETTTGSGGGTTASSSAGEGGGGGTGGEGGSGEGGSGEGGGGGTGGSEECVTCSAPLVADADPADLCESSKPKYDAVTQCICETCGAADGDPCYVACTTDEVADAECNACGTAAATTAEGACIAEGTACLMDGQ
ncbi:hypothetical protein WMF39_34310 [Sorangium sp. So ce1504]|uniref:hypothetical protein n=1 Tax=Sorangium sp. So ce1504 TaxID=3133337 RepID=UPI003F5F918C